MMRLRVPRGWDRMALWRPCLPEALLIECSTLSPVWIRELDEAVTHRGLRMAEAPVTGSRTQAEAGQLNFLVGADQETLAAVAPVLQCMSKEILHLGPVGSGAQLKLINNFLCAVQVTSFAEALVWMERTGLRLDSALDFLKRGAPGSGILSAMSERMTRRTYDVNFLLRLMAKDLRYARAAAAQLGIDVSTSSPAQDLFRQSRRTGTRRERHVRRCRSGSSSERSSSQRNELGCDAEGRLNRLSCNISIEG